MGIKIIAERKDFLIVFKPAQIHSVKGKSGDSIAGLLEKEFPQLIGVSPNDADCGLVNRLDFETSGILVAAKTRAAWNELHELFTSEGVKKEYLVLLEESPSQKQISGFIGPKGKSSKKMQLFESAGEKRLWAESTFTVLKEIEGTPLLLATVSTSHGRRHQVRLFAFELGASLCGDVMYGAHSTLSQFFPAVTRGFYLCANRLTLRGEEFMVHSTEKILRSTIQELLDE